MADRILMGTARRTVETKMTAEEDLRIGQAVKRLLRRHKEVKALKAAATKVLGDKVKRIDEDIFGLLPRWEAKTIFVGVDCRVEIDTDAGMVYVVREDTNEVVGEPRRITSKESEWLRRRAQTPLPGVDAAPDVPAPAIPELESQDPGNLDEYLGALEPDAALEALLKVVGPLDELLDAPSGAGNDATADDDTEAGSEPAKKAKRPKKAKLEAVAAPSTPSAPGPYAGGDTPAAPTFVSTESNAWNAPTAAVRLVIAVNGPLDTVDTEEARALFTAGISPTTAGVLATGHEYAAREMSEADIAKASTYDLCEGEKGRLGTLVSVPSVDTPEPPPSPTTAAPPPRLAITGALRANLKELLEESILAAAAAGVERSQLGAAIEASADVVPSCDALTILPDLATELIAEGRLTSGVNAVNDETVYYHVDAAAPPAALTVLQ